MNACPRPRATRRFRRPGRGAGALLLLGLWFGLTGSARASGTVEGRVTATGRGVGGAVVRLVPSQPGSAPPATPKPVVVTTPEGDFRLSAPPGVYLVLAQAENRFGYFGRNPVHLEKDLTGLHLPLVPAHPVARSPVPPGEEALEGRVLVGGLPVEGAQVFLYLDPSRGLRGPGYARSEPTGSDGAYRVAVPPGTYFAATRRRAGEWRAGSLKPGDLFGVLPEFPLTLRAGEAVRADIETVALPPREQMARFRGGTERLTGIIVDGEGNPVAGLSAGLYTNPQLLDRPLALSEPTGADGRFVIAGAPPGSYHLGAREFLGGPPSPGERVGFHRGPQGSRVMVGPGAGLEQLTVVVQVVP